MEMRNLFVGQQWKHRHREQTYGWGQGEEGAGGIYGESIMETYTLPCLKQIVNGNLPCDSGDSNQGSVTI